MYEYIVTAFKVVVGVITNERLAIAGAIALGLMFIWITFSLIFSFQARFASGVRKINNYVSRNGIYGEAKPGLDYLISKMPTEFIRGYKAFERNPKSLPSENIKRFESLDMELSGGVFNQNKSVLKTYMNFVFVGLLLFSMAILGQEVSLSGYLIAEAFIIPLIFLFLAKILYYVYTAIRQNQYRMAVEEFNDMLDNLDASARDKYGEVSMENSNIDEEFDKKETAHVEHAIVSAMGREQGMGGAYNEEYKESPQERVSEAVNVAPMQEQEVSTPLIVSEQATYDETEEDTAIQRYKAFLAEAETDTDNYDQEPNADALEVVAEQALEESIEEPEIVEPTYSKEEETMDGVVQEAEEYLEPEQVVEEAPQEVEEAVPVISEIEQETEEEPAVEAEEKNIIDNFKPDFSSLLEEEKVEIKRGRGRPRKEVREEGEFVIKNDKEFEEALIRAEKLMRKNEEPLSASQTKRIEKQIKELVDAMTKYKEGR